MPLSIRPLHQGFAAQVTEVDLRTVSTGPVRDRIVDLLDRYAVVVFPGQSLYDDDQVAFARALGGRLHYGQGSKVVETKPRFADQAISDISNLADDGSLLERADPKRMYALANRLWHTDASFQDPPGRYSMLSAKVVPTLGGQTEFADTRAAYEELPAATRRELAGLSAHHSVAHSRATLGFLFTEEQRAQFPGADHPIVRKLPSGRTSLYIGAHASHVLDVPVPEGRVLLHDLAWHATQSRFVYSHDWRAGDVVIWDNRATMHRGRPYDELHELRDLRRVTTLDVDDEADVATEAVA
ncbi:MAG TPA: TauD/TfdA family dioxygenase [Candidatus Elarobacter sp.]|nr:TauD/TfdA family dioxygenase [Candidatus Elarobacter sp.]